MSNIVACKDCKNCKYFEMLDKYYMGCHARNKKYMYGQWVPCEDKIKGTYSPEEASHVEDSGQKNE